MSIAALWAKTSINPNVTIYKTLILAISLFALTCFVAPRVFAATYGACGYGDGKYNEGCTTPSAPGTPTTTSPTSSSFQTWVWSAATDTGSTIASYSWRVTNSIGDLIASGTTTLTEAVTNLAEGVWNFFVKAINSFGIAGPESQGTVTVNQATATPTSSPSGGGSSSPGVDVTAGAAHLIAPGENALLATQYPSFSWQAPAEPQNVASYDLIIDGQSFFGVLPSNNTETVDFIFVFEASTQRYLLQSKKPLPLGEHTWRITSKSTTGQKTESSERNFKIVSNTGVGEANDNESTSNPTATTKPSPVDTDKTASSQISDVPQSNPIALIFPLQLPSLPDYAPFTPAVLKPIAPVAPIILTALAAVAAIALVAVQTGTTVFSFDLVTKVLRALGLFSYGRPQGIVYDSVTHAPIPFALLTITNQNKTIQETTVTDVYGVYKGVKLTSGTYTLVAGHQDFAFPTRQQRPSYLTERDFYQGNPFKVTSEKTEQLFLIPMDNKVTSKQTGSLWKKIKLAFIWAMRNQTHIGLAFFVFSGVMTVFAPTLFNIALTIIYAVFIVLKGIQSLKRPLLTGVVRGSNNEPLPQAILKFILPGANQLASIVASDMEGRFKAFIEKGNYQMMVVKPGYIWSDSNNPLSLTELKLKQKRFLQVTMDSPQHFYKNFISTSSVPPTSL